MDTTLTMVVDWEQKTLHVEGTLVEFDALYAAELNVSKILEVRNILPNTVRLQTELENRYIKEQIISLFKLWGKSSTIIIRDTAEVLGVDKHEALQVLKQGINCGVLARGFNSAWKIESKMTRDSLLACVSNMTKSNKPVRNAEELLHENMERMKKDEENSSVVAAVSEEEEPIQITVGMKGVASQKTPVKRVPMKLSTIPAYMPEPISLALPKKKPVVLPTEASKKSRKPAKS